MEPNFSPGNRWQRVAQSMVFQRRRSLRCPNTPRLDGKTVLITGATGGIGEATARGMIDRGARVIVPCRNMEKGRALRASVAEGGDRISLVPLALDDLDTLPDCVAAISQVLGGQTLDILIENAGVWPQRYATTAQGYEIAFGTNVLGHFGLRRSLLQAKLIGAGARVVVVTGDIYILEDACTPDFRWAGPLGGLRAYCRSKLGNLWIAGLLQRRHPDLTVTSVHPGVVASDLAGASTGVSGWFKSQMMLDTTAGAQTSLYCATQTELKKGGYYHNTRGLIDFRDSDPAVCEADAVTLWGRCEKLVSSAGK